jgi:hypothetical protein
MARVLAEAAGNTRSVACGATDRRGKGKHGGDAVEESGNEGVYTSHCNSLEEGCKMEPCELGEGSRTILEAIAKGRSYDQILSAGLAATHHDVFRAAVNALEIAERVKI